LLRAVGRIRERDLLLHRERPGVAVDLDQCGKRRVVGVIHRKDEGILRVVSELIGAIDAVG
jgi:hypothetical protein